MEKVSGAGAGEGGAEGAWERGAGLVEGLVREVLDRMETLAEEERRQTELGGAPVRVVTEIRGPVGGLAEVRLNVVSDARPDPAVLLHPAPAHLRVQGNKLPLPYP